MIEVKAVAHRITEAALARARSADRFERLLIAICIASIVWGIYDFVLTQSFIFVDCNNYINYIILVEGAEPFYRDKWECYIENASRLIPIGEFLWRMVQGFGIIIILLCARWVWLGTRSDGAAKG